MKSYEDYMTASQNAAGASQAMAEAADSGLMNEAAVANAIDALKGDDEATERLERIADMRSDLLDKAFTHERNAVEWAQAAELAAIRETLGKLSGRHSPTAQQRAALANAKKFVERTKEIVDKSAGPTADEAKIFLRHALDAIEAAF